MATLIFKWLLEQLLFHTQSLIILEKDENRDSYNPKIYIWSQR